ncbi:hypothetical protein H6G17_25675 [Chroococcidiopsis sp. FACHB-1243]|uniref:hypothetical protein n=1 Tax=Chroococcidiopsis sp. [FACHB-1243] TaxID=2692781 RepID=UPI00177DFF79|nr:hypothetical protein [Chroococcidiopsis sp. [FACHB-1243]]MBD2308861.1 hypothetical protein [Chroococcidiopsis sp. [FACHB-1243]]MBE9017126.1 hypothetical protein [Chroococcidiopsidales cyanobacterium LEGE 13417]
MRREKYATYLNEELGNYVKGIQAEYDLKSISLAIELIISDHKLAGEMAKEDTKNFQNEKPSLPNQSVNLADQIAILHKQLLQGVKP